MTKEQIIEILQKYELKTMGIIVTTHLEEIADEILALPIETPTYELVDTGIDVPTEEEIKRASTSEVVRHPATKDEKIAFIAGAKWMKDEIIKRNK